jgi:hypothetical protein
MEPVWVGDSSTREWDAIWADRDYYEQLIEWLRSEGFDEKITYRVEVYLVDAPFAKVFQYATDDDGDIKLNEAGDDVELVTRTVLLSSLPPAKEAA